MKLICTQCNHENEVERIYCHNCGSKLDRSQLPVESSAPKKKKVRTGPSPIAVAFKKITQFIVMLLLAALTAAIVCIFKPTEAPHAAAADPNAEPPFFSTELEGLASSPTPVSRSYAQSVINTYMHDHSKIRKSDVSTLKLTDSWVQLTPNQVILTVRIDVYGLTTGYEEVYEIPANSGVPAKPKLVSTRLGKLPIPSVAATPITGELAKIFWKRFESESKGLKRLGANVDKEKVLLYSGQQ